MQSAPQLPPDLFDRKLIAARRAQCATGPDFVTDLVLADLVDRLASVNRRFQNAVLIGPTLKNAKPAFANVDAFKIVPTLVPEQTGDMPALSAHDHDLIVSLLDLQAVNDVPGTLTRLRQHLRADGLFIGVLIGGRSLSELRTAWIAADSASVGGAHVRVAPFMDVRDAGGLLLRAGFALPVSDTDTQAVRYANPLDLMRELKQLGAANPMLEKPVKPVTRDHLAAALSAYPVDADGRITATLELIWMSGWAPDDSQQKPLRPGSAKMSLADALKTS